MGGCFMITQLVYLKDYDWLIKVYYAVDTYYTDEILDKLESIHCNSNVYEEAKDLMTNSTHNKGFTYTDIVNRYTLIVIGITDNAEQFANTYDHEKGHAAMHIAEALGLDLLGEEFQYLQGTISQNLFKKARRFMCDHCRFELKGDLYY